MPATFITGHFKQEAQLLQRNSASVCLSRLANWSCNSLNTAYRNDTIS